MLDTCHHTICDLRARHFICILSLRILAINISVSTAFIDDYKGYNGGNFEASSVQEQNRETTYKGGELKKAIIG